MPLSNYLLLRLGAVPILFASNMGSKGPSHSALAGSSAILAILSLSLTILPFTETSTTLTGALVQVIMIVSMSFVDAILPIFLLKACHVTPQTPSAEGLSATDEKDGIEKSPLTTRLRKGSAKFWGTLRHASLLSIVIVVPIFLLCGEVQDIQRNSYVLDVCYLWLELVLSGLLTGLMLIFLSILAKTTSPVAATFLTLPSSAVLLLVFAFGSLSLFGYLGVSLCLAASAVFFGSQIRGSTETAITTKRSTLFLIRNLTIAAVACGCIYAITRGKQATVPSQNFEPICLVGDDIKGGVASHPPLALSAANDGYLGQRPAANTIANIDLIVERCSEVPNGSGIDDVVNCLSFLKDRESEYLILPKVSTGDLEERASGIPELLKHLGEHDSSTSKEESAVGSPAMASTMGVCSGPVIPFHVYWTGPATWRFELFVKAYLYTQNLPCSRLWLWLDSDVDPNAVDEMLCSDPTFQRLRPLVQRGDIVLKSWHFPHRIPIPAETLDNSMAMYSEPRPAAIDNETALADNLVRDTNGQHWLITKPAHAAFSTVQVSDAVRFIVLHLHGGLYCDMDVLLLRDMRPMLLPDPVTGPRAFAEQWVERCGPGDYNTAVISLPANSSLSTYLLRGGVRMGMNFHPRVIGRMAWRDDRNGELAMLHNAVFDPLVTNLRRQGSDTCTVPCHKNFQSSFMRVVDEPWDEWKSYEGEQEPDVVGSFPPTNRSLSTWFRGAWAYHIHNQVYLSSLTFYTGNAVLIRSTVVEVSRAYKLDGRYY